MNYVGSSPTIGTFLYVAQAVEGVLAVAFGNELCWFESHYRRISLCSQGNTQHSQKTDIQAPGGIRTHILSSHGAVVCPATGTIEVSHLRIENENGYFSP